MNKYVVKVTHVFSNLVETEAENKDAARKNAMELISSEGAEFKNYYEATIPPENWDVITKEEFEKLKMEVKDQLENQNSQIKANEQDSNIITL